MRSGLKFIFSIIFLAVALPLFFYYCIESLFIGKRKSFEGISQALSMFPGLSGVYFRRSFYILVLKRCAWDSYIGFGTIFSHPSVEIGRHVYIGTFCTVGDVSFGDYVTVGSNVDIMNGPRQHYIDNIDIPVQEQGGEYPRIFIGEDSWIGNSAVVLANVGKKCVIGAGSVVVENAADYTIAVGNPAKVIKKRE